MTQRSEKFALTACALAASVLVAACNGGDDGDAPAPDDGAAPTLVIEDNITVAKAKANVTFILSFSESVGASLSNSDIVVEGGKSVALVKVNDQKFLLEVEPPKNSAGMLRVSVPVGAYTDRFGNRNLAASMHEQEFDTVVVVPPPAGGDVVLASFDETPPPEFVGFDGAETSSIAAGPAGGSGKAGKIVRLGGQNWAGAKVNTGPIALTATNRTISARVHSAVAGVRMVLKLENATDASINSGDIDAVQTVVVGWQTLTWVVPADKIGPSYSWAVMLPNLGTVASADPGETYYVDDIKLVLPPAATDLSLTAFEEAPPLEFAGFDGGETSSIAAGPAGGSGLAGKVIRLGGQVWAGAKVNVGPIPLTATNRTISARVHSPVAGVRMVLKLENATDASINSGDIDAVQTVVVGWQTLTWVVPADKIGPSYSWLVMLPNLTVLASADPGETYYFDDFKLVIAPPPTDTVLSSFEESPALEFAGFDGGETSSIAAGPAGGSGLAGKVVRLGGQVWAGAKVNVGPIPLAAGKRKISARVHSAVAGVRMVLKLENQSDASINSGDIDCVEPVVVGWQTLTWVVPADKIGPSYSWLVMLPNLTVLASADPGETYYFDDFKLADGP